MTMQRLRRNLLGGLAALSITACGLVPPADLQSPKLSFSGFGLESLSLEEVRFRITVDAENPNDVDIPLRELAFRLDLMGQAMATGRPQVDQVVLPRRSSRTVPIEFSVRTGELVEVLRTARWAAPEAIGYRLQGEAKWGRSPFTVRFERKGDFEALRLLQQMFEAPRR